MTSFSGVSGLLTDLENSMDSIKRTFERDAEASIKLITRTSEEGYRAMEIPIRDFLISQKNSVEADFKEIEKIFDDVKNLIERTADKAFNTLVEKTDSELQKFEHSSENTINEIRNASKFMRTEVGEKIRSAIKSARDEFISMKNIFSSDIENISNEIVEKTRSVINEIKRDSQSDINKLNSFRETVDDEITSKFKNIEKSFDNVKKTAERELDSITILVTTEGKKLEKKVEEAVSAMYSGSVYLGIAAVLLGGVIALGIIYEKEKQYTIKINKKKK